jgi:hypothetical protein
MLSFAPVVDPINFKAINIWDSRESSPHFATVALCAGYVPHALQTHPTSLVYSRNMLIENVKGTFCFRITDHFQKHSGRLPTGTPTSSLMLLAFFLCCSSSGVPFILKLCPRPLLSQLIQCL